MVGIIVTGHAHFATGITSSVELLGGPQEAYIPVDFDDSVDKLEQDLEAAMQTLKNDDGIIVFADLVGGSPFKTAVTVSMKHEKVEVIGGANLGMICEIALSRTMGLDLETLAEMAISAGTNSIARFKLAANFEETVEEDGI